MAKATERTLYGLDFTDRQHEEIAALIEGIISVDPLEPRLLTRRQWVAVSTLAMGEAAMIEGSWNPNDPDNQPNDATEIDHAAVQRLRGIARDILVKFQPGDGQT